MIVLTLCTAVSAETAVTVCRTGKDPQSNTYWQWRVIEGKKCWYPGRDVRAKSLLTWERVIERKFYTREDLELKPFPEQEFHPDEMVDSFDERWKLR